MCTYKEIIGQDNVGYNTIIKCAVQTAQEHRGGRESRIRSPGETLMAQTQWDSRWMGLKKKYNFT